ncbi:MAG: hypothetical protein MUQ32_15965 [Chloroflexi bacterium]|nr:hypothetical protein [Chloroflexota bacterium]
MSAPALPSRDGDGPDALVTDRYLETLLASGDRRAVDSPADTDLDPHVRAAALVLRRSMVRVHPSFRFEERLAERIAGMAARVRPAAAGGTVLAFPGVAAGNVATGRLAAASLASGSLAGSAGDPLLDAILRGDLDPSDAGAVARADGTPGPHRPLIVGGAITSAAISIVGVAWVAWRASHPAGGATPRFARTARSRRGTAVALPGGLGGPA